MSVRFLGHQDLPVTPAQRAAQQDDVALREVQRQRVEREQAEREFEQEELARLRAGFPTARQTKAEEILRYLHGLTSGYWAFHNAADATNQSTLDGGAALRLVTTAAVEAVREALQPMLERAEHELEAAVEERRAILERGHR